MLDLVEYFPSRHPNLLAITILTASALSSNPAHSKDCSELLRVDLFNKVHIERSKSDQRKIQRAFCDEYARKTQNGTSMGLGFEDLFSALSFDFSDSDISDMAAKYCDQSSKELDMLSAEKMSYVTLSDEVKVELLRTFRDCSKAPERALVGLETFATTVSDDSFTYHAVFHPPAGVAIDEVAVESISIIGPATCRDLDEFRSDPIDRMGSALFCERSGPAPVSVFLKTDIAGYSTATHYGNLPALDCAKGQLRQAHCTNDESTPARVLNGHWVMSSQCPLEQPIPVGDCAGSSFQAKLNRMELSVDSNTATMSGDAHHSWHFPTACLNAAMTEKELEAERKEQFCSNAPNSEEYKRCMSSSIVFASSPFGDFPSPHLPSPKGKPSYGKPVPSVAYDHTAHGKCQFTEYHLNGGREGGSPLGSGNFFTPSFEGTYHCEVVGGACSCSGYQTLPAKEIPIDSLVGDSSTGVCISGSTVDVKAGPILLRMERRP